MYNFTDLVGLGSGYTVINIGLTFNSAIYTECTEEIFLFNCYT